jgi:hypothetical protein
VCSVRSICIALLAFFVLSSAGVSAGDYSVTYAIDGNGKNDVGKIETCDYDKPCEIKPVGFGLSIFLSFIRAGYRLYQPQHPWAWPNTLYWRKSIR